MDRINQYWAENLDVTPYELEHEGIVLAPNNQPDKANQVNIFMRGNTCIISMPSHWTDEIRKRATNLDFDSLLESLESMFLGKIKAIVGPLYQGYAEHKDFKPHFSNNVQRIQKEDHFALDQLAEACDPTEWKYCGIQPDSPNLFGFFQEGKLLCAAHYDLWSPCAASIGVITHPDYRDRSFGKITTSAAMKHAFDNGYLIIYQTHMNNFASIHMAEQLGIKMFAWTLKLTF